MLSYPFLSLEAGEGEETEKKKQKIPSWQKKEPSHEGKWEIIIGFFFPSFWFLPFFTGRVSIDTKIMDTCHHGGLWKVIDGETKA